MNGCSQPNDFPTTTVKRPPYPKRLMDVTICVLLLPLWGAGILILGMLCLVLQGRPVFFAQQRPGLLGRPFTMYKLRTMRSGIPGVPDQEAARTTGFGRLLRRTHLDELPEFWNILRGDMSLVGPRPLLMEYLPLYDERQMRRHRMRPGLTGLAQVSGGNSLSWKTTFALDLAYVETVCFILDSRILCRTISLLFKGKVRGREFRHPFQGNAGQDRER